MCGEQAGIVLFAGDLTGGELYGLPAGGCSVKSAWVKVDLDPQAVREGMREAGEKGPDEGKMIFVFQKNIVCAVS